MKTKRQPKLMRGEDEFGIPQTPTMPPPKRRSGPPKTGRHAGKNAKDQSKGLQELTAFKEQANEFDNLIASKAPARKNVTKKQVIAKPAAKSSAKQKSSDTSAQSSAAQNKSSGGSSVQAPIPLAHTKSRRAAAVSANKKLQGISDDIESGDDAQNAITNNAPPAKRAAPKLSGAADGILQHTSEAVTATDDNQQKPANSPNKGKARMKKVGQDSIEFALKPNTKAALSSNTKIEKTLSGTDRTQDPVEKAKGRPAEAQSRADVPAIRLKSSERAIVSEDRASVLPAMSGAETLSAIVGEDLLQDDGEYLFHDSPGLAVEEPKTPSKKPKLRNAQTKAVKVPEELRAEKHTTMLDRTDETSTMKEARLQLVQNENPVELSNKDTTMQQPVSNPPGNMTNVQGVTSRTEQQAIKKTLSGFRDPFASKLNAVVTGGEATSQRPSVSGLVTKSDAARTKPAQKRLGTTGERVQDPIGQLSSEEKGSSVARSGLPVTDPRSLQPMKKSKRKAEVEHISTTKIARVGLTAPAKSRFEETTPLIASRKIPLISFGASGPRNQGTVLRKSRMTKTQSPGDGPAMLPNEAEPFNAEAELSNEEAEPFNEEAEPLPEVYERIHGEAEPLSEVDESIHEKAIPMHDEAIPVHEEIVPVHHQVTRIHNEAGRVRWSVQKQRKRLMALTSPREKRSTVPLVPERLVSNSSQTRVDANGSPMRDRHPTNAPTYLFKPSSLRDDAGDDVESPCLDNDDGDPFTEKEETNLQPTLPSKAYESQASMPQPGAYTWVNVTRNTKQVPSSPNAPSVTSALPVHHVYQSGEIVNPRTEETIVPSVPQDPFAGESADSSFNQLLRKATEKGTKRPAEDIGRTSPKKPRLSIRASLDDPDNTLVEAPKKSKHRKTRFVEVSSSSSSSEQGSEDEPSPTLVEKDLESTADEWRKALQPHQQRVLDILTEISHRLLAHLIRNEDAFMDMVNDFAKGGNLLIDHYEKDCQAKLDAHSAVADDLKQKMRTIYSKTSADLKKEAVRVNGRTQELETEWRTGQQSLLASAKTVLAACAI